MAVIVIVIIIARFIFELNFSTSELIAEDNSLAVMFIENLMDPSDSERHAEMIKELVTTDLSQSHDLHIIGSQRLYDIAKRNRKGEDRVINRENASEIAREAGARWMLVGKLSGFGSQMILTTQIERVRDGKIVDSQRSDSEDLFVLVDILTKEIKADLGFSSKPEEIDAPVKDITTSSSEAYQYYLEGLELINNSEYGEAIDKFKLAVEIDSMFTQALYKLAIAQWWFKPEEVLVIEETIKRILLKKESLEERELLAAEGLYAIIKGEYSTAKDIFQRLLVMNAEDKEIYYGLGEAHYHSGSRGYLKAVDAFEEVLNLDPEFMLAYGHIFPIYQQARMDKRAIRVAKLLIESNPDNPNGYRYLADIYGWKGEIDKSLHYYERAIEKFEGDYESIILQGWVYRIAGRYEEALNAYAMLNSDGIPTIWQYRGRRASSYVYAEKGQYKKLIQLMRDTRKLDNSIIEPDDIRSIINLTIFYSSIGDTVRASSILDSMLATNPMIDIERQIYWRKGNLYAGEGKQRELEEIVNILNMPVKQVGVTWTWFVPNILKIELYRLQGKFREAIIEYEKLGQIGYLYNLDLKANLYGDLGDWENVILTANEMQNSFLLWGNILADFRHNNYPSAFYIKGKAYEEMGKSELAIENYEALLDLWKDADEEIPERQDTIKRLAALKQES